jgi:hypothetical protein
MKNRAASWVIAAVLVALTTGFRFFWVLGATSTASVTVAVSQCSDGIDNDGDGLIDYPADPDCSSLVDDDESTPPPPPAGYTPPPGGSGWYYVPGDSSSTATGTPSGSLNENVGLFPPPPPQQELPAKILRLCDLSGDNRCDIVDLSILLFWSEQPMPQAARFDLNGDGVIDIADISILFYYWE